MLLADAAFSAGQQIAADHALVDPARRNGIVADIGRAFWTYHWPRIRHQRLKAHLWIFRPSVKIDALKPFFELVFGPAPPDA